MIGTVAVIGASGADWLADDQPGTELRYQGKAIRGLMATQCGLRAILHRIIIGYSSN